MKLMMAIVLGAALLAGQGTPEEREQAAKLAAMKKELAKLKAEQARQLAGLKAACFQFYATGTSDMDHNKKLTAKEAAKYDQTCPDYFDVAPGDREGWLRDMRKFGDKQREIAVREAVLKVECRQVYAVTANRKFSDLTVKETQDVKNCQELGMYSKEGK